VLTPTLFISYHSDINSFLAGTTSHMFTDDIAVILAGQLGLRYSEQCIDLEKRVTKFLEYLEYYSVLADQPLNYSKTEAMFISRAIGNPKFDLVFHSHNSIINWQKNYKYLGYIISRKLDWGNLIRHTEMKIRRCISLINSFKILGSSTPNLRLALFHSFALPIFSWIYPLFPLFTQTQQKKLSHVYFSFLWKIDVFHIGIGF